MNLLHDDWRCAVAIGISCVPPPEETGRAGEYLASLARQAEELDLRLQLFADAQTAQVFPHLHSLAAQGHAVDLQADLVGGEDPRLADRLRASLRTLSDATGVEAVGVRAADMARLGLQKLPAARAHLIRCGLGFVNSDYSTKLPEGASVGFADKNAAMLIKHTQPRSYGEGLLEIPSAGYSTRDFFLTQGRPVEGWCDHLRRCLDFCHDIGGLLWAPALDLGVLMRHDPGLRTLETLATHGRSKRSGRVGFLTYREIHAHTSQSETG